MTIEIKRLKEVRHRAIEGRLRGLLPLRDNLGTLSHRLETSIRPEFERYLNETQGLPEDIRTDLLFAFGEVRDAEARLNDAWVAIDALIEGRWE